MCGINIIPIIIIFNIIIIHIILRLFSTHHWIKKEQTQPLGNKWTYVGCFNQLLGQTSTFSKLNLPQRLDMFQFWPNAEIFLEPIAKYKVQCLL